jgi:RING finger and CHY zinc finger domain-containing protein 1
VSPLPAQLYFLPYLGHVEAPCCRLFYSCKLCHDEKFEYKTGCQVERMEFDKVERVRCLKCQEEQEPAHNCSKCGVEFGWYSCLKCRLYENNPDKVDDIFHCENCKMCRRGTP